MVFVINPSGYHDDIVYKLFKYIGFTVCFLIPLVVFLLLKSIKYLINYTQIIRLNNRFFMDTISIEQVLKSFQLTDDSLRNIKSLITKECELGLKDEDASCVKMLITYVRELTRGDEEGTFLALDLGGTHFRVLLIEMDKGVARVSSVAVHDIPESLFRARNGQELFDYIALKLLNFVQTHKLKRRRISLGFTFSFPCKQYGLTQSVLVAWTKGFSVGGVVGTDVVKQLKDALKRQLSGLVEAYIDVVAVINDTTGTLVACANTNKDCRIGLIVGTGFNACYIERLDKCEKWPANYNSPKQVIINCEWGAMGDHKERRQLEPFRNEFDIEIDKRSINPGCQNYEKMVSGMYLGELLRLSMIKLFKAKLLFAQQPDIQMAKTTTNKSQNEAANINDQSSSSTKVQKKTNQSKTDLSSKSVKSTSSFKNIVIVNQANNQITSNSIQCDSNHQGHRLYWKDILHGKHISMLAKDELSGQLEEAAKIAQLLGICHYTQADLKLMVDLSSKIIHRSAHLVAAGISALLERIGKPKTAVGFDGSVIKHHPYFLHLLEQKCIQLTSKQFKVEFVESSDGSGIGAAVVAAALHKERRPLYIVKQNRLFELHYGRLKKENQ